MMLADVLLLSATFGLLIYCQVLSRRLKRFNALEGGMGGAVAVLSAQVDEMTRAVVIAGQAATESEARLQVLTRRADAISRRMEISFATKSCEGNDLQPTLMDWPRNDVRRVRRRPSAEASA